MPRFLHEMIKVSRTGVLGSSRLLGAEVEMEGWTPKLPLPALNPLWEGT